MGLFNPQSRGEQAHYVYHENARFREDLRENKRKTRVRYEPSFWSDCSYLIYSKAKSRGGRNIFPKRRKCLCLQGILKHERNMNMEKYITENGIKYELRGEQYYPMLEISEQTNYEIGKYGHLHLEFIKKHRRGTYTTLLTENRLNEHLRSIDEQAHEQMDLHIARMAEQMGATEELKTSDPMRWVQIMNSIKASTEEIILQEVVYK